MRDELAGRRRLKHLILCREYPPAPYPAGGIGTYAWHIARLLAEAGETVHLIAQRWDGAPEPVSRGCDGRLIVHRVAIDEPVQPVDNAGDETLILKGLASSTCPSQLFSWQAARYAERLIEEEAIDIVEAQEWEAPLYYLQVRRMLGLDPARNPPCIVHLHSPTQMIFEHNEWDKTLVDFLPLARFEEFSIRAADALLCPSHYLAAGVSRLFGLPPESIKVIRYPMGETQVLPRTPEVWSRNAICYVGRLELRKGVVEWVDAAIRVAGTNHTVTFDFFGSDTSIDGGAGESVMAFLRRRIPHALRSRFIFHGSQTRPQLMDSLARFAIAVVPSRWENLPFTCIEAMASGLPVLVSPNGGMAELIRDRESGWVAADGSASGLADALMRALATPAAGRAAMGARAADSVRRVCANAVVVRQHLEFKTAVVRAGTGKAGSSLRAAETERFGMGIALTCAGNPKSLSAAIASVRAQTHPVTLLLVLDAAFRHVAVQGADCVIHLERFADAARAGCASLLHHSPNLHSIAILDETMRLAPAFAETCDRALRAQPAVAVVAPWIAERRASGLDTGPIAPVLPSGWQENPPIGAAIRVEALLGSPKEPWTAVTYPEPLVLSERRSRSSRRRRYSGMALIQNPSAGFTLRWILAAPLREQVRWLMRIVLRPGRIGRWIAWQVRRRLK